MSEEVWSYEDFNSDRARLFRRSEGCTKRPWSLVAGDGEAVYLDRLALVSLRDVIKRELYWEAQTPGEETEAELESTRSLSDRDEPKPTLPDAWNEVREGFRAMRSALEKQPQAPLIQTWSRSLDEVKDDIHAMRSALEDTARILARADVLKAQADAIDMGAVHPLCLSEEISGRQCTLPRGHTGAHFSEPWGHMGDPGPDSRDHWCGESNDHGPHGHVDVTQESLWCLGAHNTVYGAQPEGRDRCGYRMYGLQCARTDGHDGAHGIRRDKCSTTDPQDRRCLRSNGHWGVCVFPNKPVTRCPQVAGGKQCLRVEGHEEGHHYPRPARCEVNNFQGRQCGRPIGHLSSCVFDYAPEDEPTDEEPTSDEAPRCTASHDGDRCIKPLYHRDYHVWSVSGEDTKAKCTCIRHKHESDPNRPMICLNVGCYCRSAVTGA